MSAYVYVFVYAESIFFNKRYYVETLMKIISFLILLNPKQTWRTIYLFAVQVSLVQTVCVGGICAPSHLPAPEPNERGSTSWCDLFSLLHFFVFLLSTASTPSFAAFDSTGHRSDRERRPQPTEIVFSNNKLKLCLMY